MDLEAGIVFSLDKSLPFYLLHTSSQVVWAETVTLVRAVISAG